MEYYTPQSYPILPHRFRVSIFNLFRQNKTHAQLTLKPLTTKKFLTEVI